MDDKDITKTAVKMDKVFEILRAEGIVEKVEIDGKITHKIVEGRKGEFYGVMDYLMNER